MYNFARRNKLVLRTTTELSNAMNQLTYRDLELKGLVSNPKFSACFQDPRRIFNMDESPFGIGESKPRIWAKRGTSDVLYNKSGSSRENLTLIATINAAGDVAVVRMVYKNKNNIAKNPLKKDIEELYKT